MALMDESTNPVFDILAEAPAPLVFIVDQIHNDIINPKLLTRHCVPFYKRHLPVLHAAGKYAMLHVDGNFRKVLRLIGETEMDAAESLTPKPVGDVEISELRELAGPNLILWGGLPGALFSRLYPEDNLRDCVMQCLEHHKAYGRFIFGVADEVPTDGDMERVRMVTELVTKYGSYSGRPTGQSLTDETRSPTEG
jgi:uroporphyrinogen-III decarboxylase